MHQNALELFTFVKGRLNFSCKSTTAANVDLTESLLDNWLKNNHITDDKIHYLRSLFVFFYEFQFSNLFLNRRKPARDQLAKIRLKYISQSNGSIGRPLGFVFDKLNTSASLYRIAPCLRANASKDQRNRGHSSKFNFAHTLSIGRLKSHTYDKDVRLLKFSLV